MSRPDALTGAERASIVHHKRQRRRVENDGSRIGRDRFEQKTGFGERRSAAKPPSTKIFLLPKIATQSPRNAGLGRFNDPRRPGRASDRECAIFENHCRTSVSCSVDIIRCASLRVLRFAARRICRANCEQSSHASARSRKHFLKRDAVFFDALVYSGCSASRFPSARSD